MQGLQRAHNFLRLLSSIQCLHQDHKAGQQRTLMGPSSGPGFGANHFSPHDSIHWFCPFLEFMPLLLTVLPLAIPRRPKSQLASNKQGQLYRKLCIQEKLFPTGTAIPTITRLSSPSKARSLCSLSIQDKMPYRSNALQIK